MKQIIIFLAIIISTQLQSTRAQKWETIPKTEDVTSFFFTDQQNGWYVANYGMIYHTKDAGKTWKLMIEPGSAMGGGEDSKSTAVYSYNFMCHPREIFFLNSKMGWIALNSAYGQVIRTTDGGNTWLDINEFDKLNSFDGIYFSDEKHGWACGTFGNYKLVFFATDDGGVNWKPVDVNLHLKALPEAENEKGTDANDFNKIPHETNLYRIVFSDPQHGWVIGDQMVIFTKDGGKTWERDTTMQDNYQDMFALAPDDCWYAEYNTIVHVLKGVKTEVWKDIDFTSVESIYFADKMIGYACGGIAKNEVANDPDVKPTGYILQTTDGGKTWKNIRKENNIISGIQALPDKSILFGYRGGIIRLIP